MDRGLVRLAARPVEQGALGLEKRPRGEVRVGIGDRLCQPPPTGVEPRQEVTFVRPPTDLVFETLPNRLGSRIDHVRRCPGVHAAEVPKKLTEVPAGTARYRRSQRDAGGDLGHPVDVPRDLRGVGVLVHVSIIARTTPGCRFTER